MRYMARTTLHVRMAVRLRRRSFCLQEKRQHKQDVREKCTDGALQKDSARLYDQPGVESCATVRKGFIVGRQPETLTHDPCGDNDGYEVADCAASKGLKQFVVRLLVGHGCRERGALSGVVLIPGIETKGKWARGTLLIPSVIPAGVASSERFYLEVLNFDQSIRLLCKHPLTRHTSGRTQANATASRLPALLVALTTTHLCQIMRRGPEHASHLSRLENIRWPVEQKNITTADNSSSPGGSAPIRPREMNTPTGTSLAATCDFGRQN